MPISFLKEVYLPVFQDPTCKSHFNVKLVLKYSTTNIE